MTDRDSMEPPAAPHDDGRGTSGRFARALSRNHGLRRGGECGTDQSPRGPVDLELTRALDHLRSLEQQLIRDPLDLRRLLAQHPVEHSRVDIVTHNGHPALDSLGAQILSELDRHVALMNDQLAADYSCCVDPFT